MATPSLFPQFMKAQSGGAGGPTTGVTLIEAQLMPSPLEAAIETDLSAEIVGTTLTAELVDQTETLF
jgi:hypothetical protein